MASNAIKNRIMWIALLVCTAGVVGIVYFTDLATESTVPDPAQQPAIQTGAAGLIPAPQPPGAAPPGKTWSAEHGHWHDSAGNASPVSIQAGEGTTITPSLAPTFTPSPQPPGEAPPGKVWNEPHGHWHDAPGQSTTIQPTSILPGVDPPSPPPTFTPSPQPPGDPPPGKIWNEPHGHWHDDPALAPATQSPTIRQIEVKPKDTP